MRQLNKPNPFIRRRPFTTDTPAMSCKCVACQRYFTSAMNRDDVVICHLCGFRQFRKWARS